MGCGCSGAQSVPAAQANYETGIHPAGWVLIGVLGLGAAYLISEW